MRTQYRLHLYQPSRVVTQHLRLLRSFMSLPCKRPGSPSSSPLMQHADLYPPSEFTEPPDIPPHLTLETFNHKSTMNDEIVGSDKTNERLTKLGERLLEFVAMQSVYNRRIPVPAGKMSVSSYPKRILKRLEFSYDVNCSIGRV